MQGRNPAIHYPRLILSPCDPAPDHPRKNSRQQQHRNATCSKTTTSNPRTGGHQGSMTEHNRQLHPGPRPLSFRVYKKSTTTALVSSPGERTTMKTTGNTILITGGGS